MIEERPLDCAGHGGRPVSGSEPSAVLPFPLALPDGSVVGGYEQLKAPGSVGKARNSIPGRGSALAVIDVAGPDHLVGQAVGPDGRPVGTGRAATFQGQGELRHPYPGPGGSAVVIEERPDGPVVLTLDAQLRPSRTIPPPVDTSGLSFPTWVGDGEIVVAVEEPIGFDPLASPGGSPLADPIPRRHFADQSNLWRVDIASGDWTRLTEFRADGDTWYSTQTPVELPSGAVDFIVLSGRGSRGTGDLRSERWRYDAGRITRVEEMPLDTGFVAAGESADEVFVSQWDEVGNAWTTGIWAGGSYRALACGAARVDQLDIDPDLAD